MGHFWVILGPQNGPFIEEIGHLSRIWAYIPGIGPYTPYIPLYRALYPYIPLYRALYPV